MKKALITGITGQDGAYLAKFLLSKGYEVYGTYRRLSTPNFWRIKALDIDNKLHLISMDLNDTTSIFECIEQSSPHEIYHLAAQSFVGASFEQPLSTGDITGIGTARMLEAILKISTDIKFYNASTSELFGNSSEEPLSEVSKFEPRSPYSVAKLYSYWMTKTYREAYNLFCSNGILFNHESPLRGIEFVTRKITNAVAKIKLGIQEKIYLGNILSYRDWGYALDYVEGMWRILQHDIPDDFVLATGESHSVEELLNYVCELAGLEPNRILVISKNLKRPLEVDKLIGNAEKAEKTLDWAPKIHFHKLIEIMFKEDLKRWTDYLDGKPVLWDAMSYPDENTIIRTRYKVDR